MTDFTITLYTLYAIKQKYLRYNGERNLNSVQKQFTLHYG